MVARLRWSVTAKAETVNMAIRGSMKTPSDADTPLTARYVSAEPGPLDDELVRLQGLADKGELFGPSVVLWLIQQVRALDATRSAGPGLREALERLASEARGHMTEGHEDGIYGNGIEYAVDTLRAALSQPDATAASADPPLDPTELAAANDVERVLAETLHEMQCRRKHPHPWNHSYSMMAGQLARALAGETA